MMRERDETNRANQFLPVINDMCLDNLKQHLPEIWTNRTSLYDQSEIWNNWKDIWRVTAISYRLDTWVIVDPEQVIYVGPTPHRNGEDSKFKTIAWLISRQPT